MPYCKESNKLVTSSNFGAWKKRTNLNLIEDEVMDYIEGSTVQPPKEDAPAYAKYMKGEIRAQRILIESIKDSLIPYVSKLKTAKQIYEKLVELFSVSTAGEAISLRQELYKMKLSREAGIAPYFMRISEIRDQLQELGEVMSDTEMTTVVLNALPKEWGNFTSGLYRKKEATPFHDFGSLCKIEETRLKAKGVTGSSESSLYNHVKEERKIR